MNDWSISEKLLKRIKELKPKSILEIGAGEGTYELRKIANVISIESEMHWLPKSQVGHYEKLVRIDKNTGWYDFIDMEIALCGFEYDMIIVDGPSRKGRHGFLHNLDMFDTRATIIIDDTHRPEIKEMAKKIAKKLDRPVLSEWDKKREYTIISKLENV